MATESMNPTISIIVPVYNAETYLQDCLESVLMQTYPYLEIICVNDGSMDRSGEILEAYAGVDKRVKIYSQENAGVSSARNRGLDVATGDYVMFVDSDDYIAINACESLVNAAANTSADIVVFGGRTFPSVEWKDNAFAKRRITYKQNKVIEALLFEPGSKPLMCNKMYARSILTSSGARFEGELKLGEDQAFQFCVFPHARVVTFEPLVLYYYRTRGESLLGMAEGDSDDKLSKHYEVVRYIVSKWADAGLLPLRGRELLTWLADFLYDSMRVASFDKRLAISRLLADLVADSFGQEALGKLDSANRRKMDFMLGAHQAMADDPVVSFAFVSDFGEELTSDALHSVLNQSEQRIECLVSSDYRGIDTVEAIVERDSRCRFVDIERLDSIARACSGRFVIVASGNCEYERDAISRLLEYLAQIQKWSVGTEAVGNVDALWASAWERLAKTGVGAISFEDSDGTLRCEDPYLHCDPDNSKGIQDGDVVDMNAIATRSSCVLSIGLGNKMFSRDWLLEVLKQVGPVDECSIAFDLVAALNRMDAIAVSRLPLFEYAEFEFGHHRNSSDDGEDPISRRLRECVDMAGALPNDDSRKGMLAATAVFCLSLDDSIGDFEVYERVHPAMSSVVRNALDALDATSVFKSQEDIAQAISLEGNQAGVHFREKSMQGFRRARMKCRELSMQVNQLKSSHKKLREDIEEFHESISYRAGRVITFPLRKLYYGVKTKSNR